MEYTLPISEDLIICIQYKHWCGRVGRIVTWGEGGGAKVYVVHFQYSKLPAQKGLHTVPEVFIFKKL